MIKNILFPEKIGAYYIFPRRIVGFDIQRASISATQIYQAGKNITIEKIIEEPIAPFAEAANAQEEIIKALKRLNKKLSKASEIRCALPSSVVIFKELTFPFLDKQQIQMVLSYELESIIPFSINEAVIDFIVTHQDIKEKKSTILAAVTQQHSIDRIVNLFMQAEIPLASISVDIFALYGLYKETPRYIKTDENHLLLSLNYTTIVIACIEQGQLKIIRSFPKGVDILVSTIAQQLGISQEEALSYLQRYGAEDVDNKQYQLALQQALNGLINDIRFTINSLQNLLPSVKAFQGIILTHMEFPIPGLTAFLEKYLALPCSTFDLESLFKKPGLKIKDKKAITQTTLLSVAIAYPSILLADFNIMKVQLTREDECILIKQLVVGAILLIAILITLFLHSYRQLGKLSNELNQSKQEIVTVLKNTFAITQPAALRTPGTVLQAAKAKVEEEEALWFAFSTQTRFAFLKYLQELSTVINRQEIGLDLKKLTMTEGIITMQASVPDFKALAKLEESLKKSTLFKDISTPQETDFTITITLKKPNEENV